MLRLKSVEFTLSLYWLTLKTADVHSIGVESGSTVLTIRSYRRSNIVTCEVAHL